MSANVSRPVMEWPPRGMVVIAFTAETHGNCTSGRITYGYPSQNSTPEHKEDKCD